MKKCEQCGANCQFASSWRMSPTRNPRVCPAALPPAVREGSETVKNSPARWRKLTVCVFLLDELTRNSQVFSAALPPALREGFAFGRASPFLPRLRRRSAI